MAETLSSALIDTICPRCRTPGVARYDEVADHAVTCGCGAVFRVDVAQTRVVRFAAPVKQPA
jgi:hypothetical protein